MDKDWETSYAMMCNEKPICPHCAREIDPTDFRGNPGDCTEEWECPNCDKPVLIQADYSVTYTTYKKKDSHHA